MMRNAQGINGVAPCPMQAALGAFPMQDAGTAPPLAGATSPGVLLQPWTMPKRVSKAQGHNEDPRSLTL